MAKKGKTWLVFEDPIEIDAEDGVGLRRALDEALVILRDAGGAVAVRSEGGVLTIGAKRERVPIEYEPGFEQVGPIYHTTAYILRYQGFLPAVEDREEPLPEPEEEPEPEPVEEPAAA